MMLSYKNGNPLQYSCLEIPRTEDPGRLQSMGSQRIRYDWATSLHFRLDYLETHFNFFFLFFPFIFISWKLITLQYCNGFCHTLTWISHGFTYAPHAEPPSHLPPHPIPLGHPSAPSRVLVSCIHLGLVICFTLENIHVLMLFSQIIPVSPSYIEFKSLFYTSVSLFLSCIYGYHCHLSKFHMYALVYCIGLYLSGLLHSV